MKQEQSQSVSFQSDTERELFNILTTKVHFEDKIYTEQDLEIDLVLRLAVPKQTHISRKSDFPYSELFFNTPESYAQAYETVRQYINFHVDTNFANTNFKESVTKAMTSIYTLDNSKEKQKRIFIKEDNEEQTMSIDCFYQYFPEMDVFTLKYNMIMLILQSLCGFRVKTFLLEESDQKCIYFLLSNSIENLMKLADQHKITKQINMVQIDFNLNDPVDRAQRPLRYHSYFKSRQDLNFQVKQKAFCRLFKLKRSNLVHDIIREANLSEAQAQKYIQYCSELQEYVLQLARMPINITSHEKEYIYRYNRGKSNNGCYQILKQMKQRQLLYEKIIKLNKKYGYQTYKYTNSYVQFSLPPKNKSFFEKFSLLMNYKTVSDCPQGKLSLFSKMDRCKLAYLSLQKYLKVQNLLKIGLQVFAINNNYERFGTSNFNLFSNMIDWKKMKGKRLIDEWHGFIPFFTNISSVRDYMGQKFAYELLVKNHLLSFFAYILPVSFVAQALGSIFYMSENNSFVYQFTLIYLIFVIVSLRLFQVTWEVKENQFFRNFLKESIHVTHQQNYKGPYIRNIVNDSPNEYTQQLTFFNRIIRFLTLLGVGILILIEAFYFYGLRKAILANYNSFPTLPTVYISLPHLIFYGTFFWSNYLIYRFVFSKIIVKLVDFQNFPTKQQHVNHLRGYVYLFTFGVQFLGPVFIYVIEPFQEKSCYSASCIYEFSIYIYSRYFIIFSFLLIKIIYVIGFYFTGSIMEIKDSIFQGSSGQAYQSFQEKINQLLQSIQKEYRKKQISFEIRQEALSLYYYCIYSITFPFCSVLGCGLILLDYIVVRIDVLRNGRRPIPNSKNIIRLSGIYNSIVHLCIIVNSWSFIYIQEVLEYNFTEIIEYFVLNINEDNILLLKIFFTFIFIGILELISGIVKSLSYGFADIKLQNRKINSYKNFIINKGHSEKRVQTQVHHKLNPMKTVFRAFPLQSLGDMKKSRFKEKNRAKNLQSLNQKFFAPYTRRPTQEFQISTFSKNHENFEEQMIQDTQSQLNVKYRSQI